MLVRAAELPGAWEDPLLPLLLAGPSALAPVRSHRRDFVRSGYLSLNCGEVTPLTGPGSHCNGAGARDFYFHTRITITYNPLPVYLKDGASVSL